MDTAAPSPVATPQGVLSRNLIRLLGALFLLFIVPVLVAQYWIFRREEREMVQIEQSRTLTRARTIAELTTRELRGHLRVLESVAVRPRLLESWQRRDLAGLDWHLEDILKVSPEMHFAAMHDLAGTVHRVVPPDPVVGTNFAYRDWYRGVTADWRPYVSEVYRTRMRADQLVVALAVPVMDKQGRPAGILMAGLSLQTQSNALRETQEGVIGEAFVVDQRGNVVASPAVEMGSEPAAAPQAEYVRRALAGEEVAGRTGAGLEGYIVSAGPVPATKWAVLYRRPAAVALVAVANLRRDLLTVTVYLTLIFLATAAIAGRATRRYQQGVAALEKAEREAAAQRALLHSIIQNAGEGISVANERGELTMINPAGEAIVGRSVTNLPEEAGTEYFGVYRADGSAPYPAHDLPLARALRGESVRDEELLIRRPDGRTVLVLVTAEPIRVAGGRPRGGVATFIDITERKRAEELLRRRAEELKAANRELEDLNHELEAFSYSVSHDLRAPLRHMSGFAQILDEDFGEGLPAEARAHLQRICSGAKHMGRLVDDLLNLARIGRAELKRQPADLAGLVAQVREDLSRDVNGRVIAWHVAPLPVRECDPGLTRQVFTNLIGNAIKYTRTRETARIEIGETCANGHRAFFVRDNGVGFDMKYAAKLFGVFQRLHRADQFEGTGIGLATTLRIVHKHGGRIWAEAAVDQGATFFFTLGEHPAERPSAAAPGHSPSAKGEAP